MKLPDKVFGIETSKAYKDYLERAKNSGNGDEQEPPQNLPLKGVDKGDYIFMPSHNLYVAKERSHLGRNWYDTHHILHQENARMLTLREFVDFLSLLKNGNQGFQRIYNDITEVRDPYRAEWLDADFKVVGNGLNINYNHRNLNGELKPQNSEPLEDCLMENCKVDLTSFNKQGLPTSLPTRKGEDFNYWFPRSDNNSVARFLAGSDWAGFYCYGGPQYSVPALGVRSARRAAP